MVCPSTVAYAELKGDGYHFKTASAPPTEGCAGSALPCTSQIAHWSGPGGVELRGRVDGAELGMIECILHLQAELQTDVLPDRDTFHQ
jgi:hypothetical protein